METDTKKLTTLAMLSTIAYLVMVIGRFPVVLFLKYDPKDVIITIGGFIFGPLSAFTISLLVSLVEMITVSDTGLIGFLMNVLSTCAFACTAAYIYQRDRTLRGAVLGLVTGSILMTGAMLLWNYIATPYFLGVPREQVVALLLPAILPFNLLKSGLNAAVTMLLYKPIVGTLRRRELIPESHGSAKSEGISLGVILVSLIVLVTCILLVLIIRGMI